MDKQNVDPALWPLVDAFPPIDVTAATLEGFRAAFAGMSAMPDPASHPEVRIETISIEGGGAAADRVRCLLYRPRIPTTAGALLHIHGGGFVMGSPEMDAARNIALVRATGCTILSPEYRLAPEHPHPAALEDCHAALQWLGSTVHGLDHATGRIGLIGESAGGGLAAALALLARDRQSVRLACQALIYPMVVPPAQSLDVRLDDPRTGQFIWTRTSNEYCWSANLPGGRAQPAWPSAPTEELRGLPSAFLAVGELDLFVHDNLALASRLLAAGCSVEAHLYPGAIHGFDRMVDAAVSQRYTGELVAFLLRHLG